MSRSPGEEALALHIKAYKLPAPVREYRFAKDMGRLWAFDFAWPDDRPITSLWHYRKLAVEIDGSVHRTKGRFRRDIEKMNVATSLGWWVLRFRPADVESGQAIDALRAIFTPFRSDNLLTVLQRKDPA